MSNTAPDPIAAGRAKLLAYEQERRQLSQRALFWRARDWEIGFDQLIRAEDERDRDLEQQIADRTISSPYLQNYEKRLFDALSADRDWHSQLSRRLDDVAQQWAGEPRMNTALAELNMHRGRVVMRQRNRAVRLAEAALDILERRRYADGELPEDDWSSYWRQLHSAWEAEDRLFAQLRTNPRRADDPLALEHSQRLNRRLEWLRRLRDRQIATREQFDKVGRDTSALRSDLTLVEREIRRLAPPSLRRLPQGGRLAAALAVVAACLIGFFLIFNSRGAPQTAEATPSPAPTTAQIAVIDPPTPVTAQASGLVGPLPTLAPNDQGLALLREDRCDAAIPYFEQAITDTPGNYEPYNNLAFCLYELGRTADALDHWQQALNRETNSADVRAGIGMALYQQGDQESGLANYRIALEINASYADESYLRANQSWSERAITDSRPLRQALGRP